MEKKNIKELLELYIKNAVPTMKIESLKQMCDNLTDSELKILKDSQKVHRYKNMSWNVVVLQTAYDKLTKKNKGNTTSSYLTSEDEKQVAELKVFVKGKKATEMIKLVKEANLEQVRYYKEVATRKSVIAAIEKREKELIESIKSEEEE